MKRLVYMLLLVVPTCGLSQSTKHNPFFTVRGNIGIPKTLGNNKFHVTFNGVYDANVSANLRFSGDLFIGAGYASTSMRNNRTGAFAAVTTTNAGSLYYNTRLIGHGGFLKFGTDLMFDNNIGFASFSMNAGYMFFGYTNIEISRDTLKDNLPQVGKKFSAPYVQPEIAVSFLTDKMISFSVMMGYTTLFYKFDPKAARFNHVPVVQEAPNKRVMGWINLGFGFSILIPD